MSRLERIVAACGGILLDNGTRALIPGPDHSAKDRSVSLIETEEGRIVIHCFSPKDDWRSVRRSLAERGLLDQSIGADETPRHAKRQLVATHPADEDRIARARRVWTESGAIRCTPATVYLRRRAIPESLWRTDALRFHPRMTSLDDRMRRPALIAAITGADGELQGVQVTLLTAHGAAKAAVATPRRVIGKLMGGAVRLQAPGRELVVGEGVETMLSASEALNAPAWAALSAENLARFEPPKGVVTLLIALDADTAGRMAFDALRARLSGLDIQAALPPGEAADWNDWAMRRRQASKGG